MATSIKYAKHSCGRCSGQGRLAHFGHIYNGVCFACNGAGFKLTAPGKRAAAAVNAFIAATCSVPVAELVPGTRVKTKAGLKRTVADVLVDTTYHADGTPALSVRYTKAIEFINGLGPLFTDIFAADATVVLPPAAGPQWDAVLAYARSLKLKGLSVVDTDTAVAA